MTREELRGLGIEDDKIIDAILDKQHQENAEIKGQLQTAQNERDAAQTQAAQYKEEIEKYNGVDIEELKGKPAEIEAQYQAQLKQLKLDNEVEKVLAGVKHANLLKPQIDFSKLNLNEAGEVTGLSEQVDALKTTYPDFFTIQVQGVQPVKTKAEETGALTKDEIMSEPNQAKRQQLIRENLELFKDEA